MEIRQILLCILLLALSANCVANKSSSNERDNNLKTAPVNKMASKEACELLDVLYAVKPGTIISGQHNYPCTISETTDEAKTITGYYPTVWGQDFGFSSNDKDGIECRDKIIQEAINRHKKGHIITLMWHAVRPIDNEPGGWKESVQNDLTDEQWKNLVTPGTNLHKQWLVQLDVIAEYLKVLRDKDIPVLWRPYHEMNGDWFWWGKKKGTEGYVKLWRNMYNYFTHHHKLNNLLWVWNANEIRNDNIGPYSEYFPGLDVVDVLATDVYQANYAKHDYIKLKKLAQGKPIAIGECGPLPGVEVIDEQPDWVWFMCWARFLSRNNTNQKIHEVYNNSKVLKLEDM